MKKLFFILAVIMTVQINMANAQTIVRNGNNYAEQTDDKAKQSGAVETKYTYTTKDGKTYSIWLSYKGRAYIIRTSSKTGKDYKQYLSESISRQVCKDMDRTYIE